MVIGLVFFLSHGFRLCRVGVKACEGRCGGHGHGHGPEEGGKCGWMGWVWYCSGLKVGDKEEARVMGWRCCVTPVFWL